MSALSRDTWTSEGFAFPFVEVFDFVFCSSTKARFQNPAVDASVPPAIYSVTKLPIMIRCPDSRLHREARRSNQPNGDLLLHQGGPRAALHANQLRVVHLATQHPVHAHRQFPGDGDLRYAAATTQPEPLIILT